MEVTGPVGFLLPKACEDGGVLVFTFYHAMLEKAMENASASFPPSKAVGCVHTRFGGGETGAPTTARTRPCAPFPADSCVSPQPP